MIRLSRKAWNNVIIFSMLLMILLFNTTNNILTGSLDDEVEASLLPSGSMLMTLQMPSITLERIGKGWRTSQPSAVSETHMQALVSRWQDSIMTNFEGEVPLGMPVIVIAWLAGENSGRVFQLYGSGRDTIVLHQQQVYKIADVPIEQLLLVENQ
jgi:hypothetical protein